MKTFRATECDARDREKRTSVSRNPLTSECLVKGILTRNLTRAGFYHRKPLSSLPNMVFVTMIKYDIQLNEEKKCPN